MKHDVKPTKYLLVFILLNMIGTGANASDKAASKITSVLQAVSISECVSLAEIKSYNHCSKKKGTDIELYLHNSCTTPVHATVCFDYPNGKVRMDEDKIRPGKKRRFFACAYGHGKGYKPSPNYLGYVAHYNDDKYICVAGVGPQKAK